MTELEFNKMLLKSLQQVQDWYAYEPIDSPEELLRRMVSALENYIHVENKKPGW